MKVFALSLKLSSKRWNLAASSFSNKTSSANYKSLRHPSVSSSIHEQVLISKACSSIAFIVMEQHEETGTYHTGQLAVQFDMAMGVELEKFE